MKYSSSVRTRIARFVSVLFAASLLAGLNLFAAHAQPATPAPSAAPQPSAEEAAKREAWRATIARTPAPKKGCFTASYPNPGWQEAPCGRPSPYPNLPRRSRPDVVGQSIDYSAQVSGLISSATGRFASVTPATITEEGQWFGKDCPPPTPPPCEPGQPCRQPNVGRDASTCIVLTPNAFSLQLNSQYFPTAACEARAVDNMPCQGWEQFVFSQDGCPDGPCVFIQYWLLGYGSTSPTVAPLSCATPWMQSEINNWYCNSSSNITPRVPAAELQGITLTGTVAADGDQAVLTIGDVAFVAAPTPPASDGMLQLALHWNTVEWNVIGDCCLFTAGFSAGSTIVVTTSVNEGAVATCVQEGFTGETNNLSLVGTEAQDSRPPAIVFTQSDAAGGTPASCIFATEGAGGKPGQHGGPGGGACGRPGLPPCPHL
jgi:hypothetical protein